METEFGFMKGNEVIICSDKDFLPILTAEIQRCVLTAETVMADKSSPYFAMIKLPDGQWENYPLDFHFKALILDALNTFVKNYVI